MVHNRDFVSKSGKCFGSTVVAVHVDAFTRLPYDWFGWSVIVPLLEFCSDAEVAWLVVRSASEF